MLAFCHIYKTAGTTFTTLLRNHFRLKHFDRPGFRERLFDADHLRRIQRIYPGLKSIGGHPIRPYAGLEATAPDIRYYTFLRNPVARSISHVTWYLRWKANDGIFFDDFNDLLARWAQAPENRNLQCRHLSRDNTCAGVQQQAEAAPFLFLRVKHFDASLLLFRDWANEPTLNLHYSRLNTAADKYERLQHTHPDYLKRINDFLQELKQDSARQDMLREANQEDQTLVDWVDTQVWPTQIQAYTGNLDQDLRSFQESNAHTPSGSNREPLLPRLYRNAVFKPLRPFLLPSGEPEDAANSPWL
jgi:hypothetical protein